MSFSWRVLEIEEYFRCRTALPCADIEPRRGPWAYDISADHDIDTAFCPMCRSAYSDYEVTAVVPCWRCRDSVSLASIGGIGQSEYDGRDSVTLDLSQGINIALDSEIYRLVCDRLESNKKLLGVLEREFYRRTKTGMVSIEERRNAKRKIERLRFRIRRDEDRTLGTESCSYPFKHSMSIFDFESED